MMYEVRMRKPEPILLPTQGIFNLPHHIGMAREELALDDSEVMYNREMDCSPDTCYGSDRIRTPNPMP